MKKLILLCLALLTFLHNSNAQCTTPNIAANLSLNAVDTAISVYYDSTSTATKYLAILSTASSLSISPANGTVYTVGSSLGNGKIAYYGSNYVFKIGGLSSNTNYYLYVYSAATGCTGEPVYSAGALTGSVKTFNGSSGIPSGYYNSANGLTCSDLKTALYNIIKPSPAVPDPTYREILESITMTDSRLNDNATKQILWDIYSDNPTGPEPYEFTFGSPYQDKGSGGTAEGQFYNREHTFPQAWFGGKVEPMYSDLFIVYPTDKKVNGLRANSAYGIVGTPTYTSLNGSKLGNNIFSPLFTGTVFEPIDSFKGDVARSNLYVATAYEDKIASWQFNANADDILNGTSYPSFDNWYIGLLYQWHLLDPVSQKEIDRNNEVYMLQGSRNPYIDHPEYVALVWQCTGVVPVTIIDFKAIKLDQTVLLSWYATHEVDFKNFEIERSTDGISFEKIKTITGQNLANYSFADEQLPDANTIYYRIKMIDANGKISYGKIVTIRINDNFSNALIYPNPASDHLGIKLGQSLSQNSKLIITDIAGRTVSTQLLQSSQNNIHVNVQHLPSGRYFITIKNNTQLIHQSFVITR